MCRRAFKYLKSILQLKRRGRQERLCVYHFCVANTLDGVLSHDISYIMTVQFTPEKKTQQKKSLQYNLQLCRKAFGNKTYSHRPNGCHNESEREISIGQHHNKRNAIDD